MSLNDWPNLSKNKLERCLKDTIKNLKEEETEIGIFLVVWYMQFFYNDLSMNRYPGKFDSLKEKSINEYFEEYKKVLSERTGEDHETILKKCSGKSEKTIKKNINIM